MTPQHAASRGFLVAAGQTLVCLGDSITAAEDGYVTVMANLIAAAYPERAVRVVNAGISGHKAPDMLARLESDVIARRPDWVTINVGINDVWHGFFDFTRQLELPDGGGPDGVALPIYQAAVREMVRTLGERTTARAVLVTPTVIGEDPATPQNRMLQGYVDAMEAVAAAEGALVCPARQAFLGAIRRGTGASPGYALTTDGVHPNAVGHHVLAITVLRTLGFFDGLPREVTL